MRKLTKLMLTLMLLAAGVVGANAGKLYADLSKLGNGPVSTWDGATSTMTWTGKSNNMISNLDFAAGNYSSYSSIVVSVSDFNNASSIRVQIRANATEKVVTLTGEGTHEKKLVDDFGFTIADIASVEWIRILGSSWDDSHTIDADNPASAKINSVYLYQPSKTLDVDLSLMAASEGMATWDKETGKFAWTGTWSNAITLPGLSGNLTGYTTVNYETEAGTADHFRILVYYSNDANQTTYQASTGKKSITFEDMGVNASNLAFVSSIKISGASDVTGDIILKSFSLEGPLVNYIEATAVTEAPLGTTDLKNLTGTESNWAASVTYPKELAVQGAAFGNGDGSNESTHVSIGGYDYLHFYVSEAQSNSCALRVWIWDDVNNKVVTLYAYPIEAYSTVTNWEAENRITAPGTYVVNISGYKHLKGVKAANNWGAPSVTVAMAYVSSGSKPVAYKESGKYLLVGESTGSASLEAALADANATCYDATGVTGTGLELTAANPNALFVANAGALSNTQNVIVDVTCANLVLTDGYPFKAPANFNATAATYTTTINSEVKAGTLCLPFAATLPTGVTAYTLTYTGGDEATATKVEETIYANTPVLVNGKGAAQFNGSNAFVSASAANVSGALTGVFETTAVPAGSYVLQNGGDGLGFYKVAEGSTINAKPFRAYLTAQGAGARLKIAFADTTTGIESVATKEQQDGQCFDLQGRRVAQPTKGLYIVNGKKVIMK